MGSLIIFPGSQCSKILFVSSKCGVCFPQSCGSPIIKFQWPSKSDSLWIPCPFVGSPGWEAWCGAQNLHNSGRTSLLLLFSSFWVAHLAGMDLILSWLYPSYHLTAAAFLWTWIYIYFFNGFQCPPVDGCSTASWNFGALTGDKCTSFYTTILNQKPVFLFF